MKKIKKIILVVIVSLIALISVFSCFKGKYTPEPILTPVSVLKPANSVNDNIINPTGTYEKFYFNTSLSFEDADNLFNNLDYGVIEQYFIYLTVDSSNMPTSYISINRHEDYVNESGYAYSISVQTQSDRIVIYNSQTYQGNVKGFREDFINPLNIAFNGGIEILEVEDMTITAGRQNNLLTNLISPVPFLFEGTSNSISWTSSGLDNPNNIQNIYFNTKLTNQAIKNALDTYIGDTSGKDIFYYLDSGVRVRCHVINNSANAFIQIIGGSTTLYKWIYDSIDTDEAIWWYGIDPQIIDNNNVIVAPNGIALEGFNIYELRCLFSSANDFTETPSGDSYEQGYRDGYTEGETAGYNKGYTEGETAGHNQGYKEGETAGYNQGYTAGESAGQTAGYNNGYTAGQTAGYNQGYLEGLDDGAGSNVNFQYIESVLTLIGNFLNIEILPNIKLSYALGIIIILSIISIIKMVVK